MAGTGSSSVISSTCRIVGRSRAPKTPAFVEPGRQSRDSLGRDRGCAAH